MAVLTPSGIDIHDVSIVTIHNKTKQRESPVYSMWYHSVTMTFTFKAGCLISFCSDTFDGRKYI